MNVFPFIEAEKAEQRNVVKACELLEVSRSAFYEWHQHVPSARQLADEQLGQRIEVIYDESRGTYGWPRVHRALRDEGVHVGREHVARIMRDKGLVGRCRRRWVKTTISDPDVVAVDLLKRSFGPGTVELDRVYVGDITYIRTWEGWLYLATVIDLASRRVVGWAMADHMRAELVCDALRMAIENRRVRCSTPIAGPNPDSISRRNTSIVEGVDVNVRNKQRAVRAYRGQVPSPGRPTVAWREDRVRFWAAIKRGLSTEDAAAEIGVSPAVGTRWFRHAGGVGPCLAESVSGRYLSFREREDIAVWHAGSVALSRNVPRGTWASGSVQMVRASSVNTVAIRRWAHTSLPNS